MRFPQIYKNILRVRRYIQVSSRCFPLPINLRFVTHNFDNNLGFESEITASQIIGLSLDVKEENLKVWILDLIPNHRQYILKSFICTSV